MILMATFQKWQDFPMTSGIKTRADDATRPVTTGTATRDSSLVSRVGSRM